MVDLIGIYLSRNFSSMSTKSDGITFFRRDTTRWVPSPAKLSTTSATLGMPWCISRMHLQPTWMFRDLVIYMLMKICIYTAMKWIYILCIYVLDSVDIKEGMISYTWFHGFLSFITKMKKKMWGRTD